MSRLVVEFCGELFELDADRAFAVGREADLVVDDDNGYLHRRLVEFRYEAGFWWIANVGSRLSVTVSGEAGTLQSWIGPGSRIPVVLPLTSVLFTAGETTYELQVRADVPVYDVIDDLVSTGSTAEVSEATLGAVDLTPSQFLLVLALAADTLRRAGTGSSELPTNTVAAERLGWSMSTFNRKLDNVCAKYDAAGVKGLRGDSGQLATQRRARLVEYAVAAKIVRPEHLAMLDEVRAEAVR